MSTTTTIVPAHPQAPGPRGVELLRWMLRLRRDPVRTLAEAADRYGDVVRFGLPPGLPHPELLVVRRPDDVRAVLKERARAYRKSHGYDVLGLVVGEGLLTSEGRHWERQRGLIQPNFHRQRIARFVDLMAEETEDMLRAWSPAAADGRPVDVAEEMRRLALAIVGRALFSTDLRAHARAIGRGLTRALAFLDRRENALLQTPLGLPTPSNVRFRRAVRDLEAVVYTLIEARRGKEEQFEDLLSMLLEARDADTGRTMTRREVRDEVMTFLLAGHETTANALAWTWFLLAAHPGIRERLEREVDVLGDRPPSMEDLGRLPYTLRVVEEALRLYPPAWMIERAAVEPDTLGGFPVRPGAAVLVSPYLTHRHPELWPDPERFDPERFTPERSKDRPGFAYFPFGGGPRQCIGNTFALVEARVVLATVARRYRLEAVAGATLEPEARITLRPRGRLLMKIAPRIRGSRPDRRV